MYKPLIRIKPTHIVQAPVSPLFINIFCCKLVDYSVVKEQLNKMETKSWREIKDSVYSKKGTDRRDELNRDFESFKIGLLLRKAGEDKNLTQEQLGELVDKKRTYISRVENNGSNLTLKTLYDIVEKGLDRKVKISIEV